MMHLTDIQMPVDLRMVARAVKDWFYPDKTHTELAGLGIEVEDSSGRSHRRIRGDI